MPQHLSEASGPLKPMRRQLLGSLLLCFASGCDVLPGGRRQIDTAWHRQSLLENHLSRWLAVAPTDSGLFQVSFTKDWKPNRAILTDLTAQSRLVYAMASGYELTEDRRTEIFEVLFRALSDVQPAVRAKAVRSLGKLVREAYLTPAQEERVRVAVLRILGEDEAHEWDRAFIVRREAAEALRHIDARL